MRYQVTHETSYQYHDDVPIGYNRVCLAPRECLHQRCTRHFLDVTPEPETVSPRGYDYYGNLVSFFSVQEPHSTLTIRSISEVQIDPQLVPDPEATPTWESVRDLLARPDTPELLDASQFAMNLELDDDAFHLREFALESFPPGAPILVGALHMMHRIYTEFRYDPQATTVTTPINEVLANKHGVCQDFAHVQIGALRVLGLAARYVSGYITPVSNTEDEHANIGAQASHAWLSLFVPGHGWVDLDPTNDCMPTDEHITVAWGREYEDVSPVRGVVLGGGQQVLAVGVEVKRLS